LTLNSWVKADVDFNCAAQARGATSAIHKNGVLLGCCVR
jgi:hypothetical protein